MLPIDLNLTLIGCRVVGRSANFQDTAQDSDIAFGHQDIPEIFDFIPEHKSGQGFKYRPGTFFDFRFKLIRPPAGVVRDQN